METRTVAHTGTSVAWIALIISIVALVIAWNAFNRASDLTVTEELQQETGEAFEEMELYAAQLRAEMRLRAIAANAELRENQAEYERELAEVRVDLEEAYANASGEAQQEWNEIEAEFDQLESQVREGTADTLQNLQSLIGRLQADVRVDNQE